MTHYATHHWAMRSRHLKFVKRCQIQHHFKTPDKRLGVSSPLWDLILAKPAT